MARVQGDPPGTPAWLGEPPISISGPNEHVFSRFYSRSDFRATISFGHEGPAFDSQETATATPTWANVTRLDAPRQAASRDIHFAHPFCQMAHIERKKFGLAPFTCGTAAPTYYLPTCPHLFKISPTYLPTRGPSCHPTLRPTYLSKSLVR